jgi:hypothetical protein
MTIPCAADFPSGESAAPPYMSRHFEGHARMRILTVVLFGSLALLAGCGTQEPDRATGGAATGAGTGALIGILGGPIGVGVGALIGGAVGATTGAAVAPQHLTLPPPPWSGA